MAGSTRTLTRTDGGWLAADRDSICAVLESPDLGVPTVPPCGAVGTIGWLRASVSRFVNGPEHDARRARAQALIDGLDLERLHERARRHTGVGADDRHVVAVVLAEALGADRPDDVAAAVLDCAAAYFPGADAAIEQRGDAAVRRLLELLGTDDLELTVARIAVLVQACDATALLIGTIRSGSTEPPLRAMRRVALVDTSVAGQAIAAGELVTCDLVQASAGPLELTFGHGPRACPAAPAAQAIATGAAAVST